MARNAAAAGVTDCDCLSFSHVYPLIRNVYSFRTNLSFLRVILAADYAVSEKKQKTKENFHIMKQHFTKLVIGLLLMIGSTCSTAQSKLSPGAQFLEYYNAHDIKKLDVLLSDDFVMKHRHINSSVNKKEFLGLRMNYCVAFNAGYSTVAVIVEGNPEIITVKEYSDELKLLHINPSAWIFLIESKAGKITSILMDTARGADAYFQEALRKETAFRSWVEQKYGSDTLTVLEHNVDVFHDLMVEYALNPGNAEATQSEEVIVVRNDTPDDKTDYGMPCTHFGKLSLKQRLARYPFNKAKSVMLISFTDNSILYPDYKLNKDRILALGNAEDTKMLTAADIDELSDLLFNVGYDTDELFKTQIPECPELKNAIVFLDDKGKPFDYIGIYFGCNAAEYDINKIEFPVDCDDKYDMLGHFFSERGIPVIGL